MIAIVDFKGKQFQVKEGDEIKVPLFECKAGDKVVMDKVILLNEGENVKLTDELKDAKVEVEVINIGQTPKIGVLKFHSKKHYQKIGSHRQDYVLVKINKIAVK